MPVPILMPALSPTMTEGRLNKWHKVVGDSVQSGDLLMDVETDKAVMEVESTQEGILDVIVVPENTDAVKVGQVIAVLRLEGEKEGAAQEWLDQNPCDVGSCEQPGKETVQQDAAPENNPGKKDVSSDDNSCEPPSDQGRILASPLARKIAKDKGIDLGSVTGSGPRGRIIQRDLEQALSPSNVVNECINPFKRSEPTRKELTPMRKGIAKRLTASKTTVPHFYLSAECCMDDLLALRKKINAQEKILSINDFMVRACALALDAVPDMRVVWADTHLIQHHACDVAVAVSVEGGLVTPIVQHAEKKSLRDIGKEMRHWIRKACEGTLKPEEYQGGVFTVSNMGMMGVDYFYPILNPPHAGILGIGATKEKPVVRNGQVCVSSMMTASLAADHRAVDGACAAKFLDVFKSFVENPYGLLS